MKLKECHELIINYLVNINSQLQVQSYKLKNLYKRTYRSD